MANGTFSKEDLRTIRSYITMYDRNDIKWASNFARFGCLDPYNSLDRSREYLFFTKPDLNIFNDNDDSALNEYTSKIPYFCELFNNGYKDVLRHLQSSTLSSKLQGPFMNMLSWAVNSTLDLPTISSNATSTAENIYGTTMQYMSTDFSSDEKFEFTLDFEDTKFLDIYHIFKAWVEYSRYKSRGVIKPKDTYIFNRILYDQSSIYKFIVDDTQTIIHYSKVWGVFPMGVARDTFSSLSNDSGVKFSQPFMGTFVDDMDPLILRDFNSIVEPYCKGRKDIPTYSKSRGSANADLAYMPYIRKVYSNIDGYYRYKLMWRY